jgi:hypothetical protein
MGMPCRSSPGDITLDETGNSADQGSCLRVIFFLAHDLVPILQVSTLQQDLSERD